MWKYQKELRQQCRIVPAQVEPEAASVEPGATPVDSGSSASEAPETPETLSFKAE